MSVIVTLTFSPCIDKSTTVGALVADKKLVCSAPVLEPGGGGINVARAIAKLGGSAAAIYPSGGYTGRFFNELLQHEHIVTIPVAVAGSLRENMVVLDRATNQQYRFGMPGTPLTDEEWKACLEKINTIKDLSYLVVSGSLPPGVPDTIFARLAGIAAAQNARLVVDTSGKALIEASQEKVYLLKPNLAELSTLAGRSEINMENVTDVAREIISRGWCKIIVVSMGAAGAVLVTASEAYRAVPPPVIRKSTVGAGDSMLAGIIWSLQHNNNLEQALQFGVACGTAATMNAGTSLFNKPDVDKLYALINKPV